MTQEQRPPRRTRAELVPTDSALAEVIAGRLKSFRGKRMSAQKLAERCQEIGLKWDRQVIANLETGRRGIVTVGEWLALSYALSVPPMSLLLPIGEADTVEVVPGVSIHPQLARQWIDGDVPPVTSDGYVTGDRSVYNAAAGVLQLFREHVAVSRRVGNADNRVSHREYVDGRDSPRAVEARREYADALADLAAVQRRMRDGGVRPPRLPRSVVEAMRQLGIDTTGIEVRDDREGDDGAR